MNRLSKRILPVILTVLLAVGMFPALAFAAVEIEEGVGSITQPAYGVSAGDVVYFGSYEQANDGGAGEPIAWWVLSNDGNDLFLLSQSVLDAKPYNETRTSVTWETGTLRSWLNGYTALQAGASVANPYADSFINTAFSTKEQTAIATTNVINDPNPSYSIVPSGNPTQDKVFLLSIQEAQDFTGNATREAPLTAYAIARGARGIGGNGYWWLRSPGGGTNYAALVRDDGYVRDYGNYVDDARIAVRPALNLNPTSVIFTSAASAASGKTPAVGANFSETQTPSGAVKFTIEDAGQTLDSVSATDFVPTLSSAPIDNLKFTYSGATTGTNQYVSAVLKDKTSGAVVYYAKLADATTAVSGTVDLPLTGVADGDYELLLFSEQANGANNTDFCSAPQSFNITVGAVAPVLSNGSAVRTSATNATVKFTSDEAGTYYYQIDGIAPTAAGLVAAATNATTLTAAEQTISLTTPTAGAHTIYIAAKDASGNVSNLLTITIPAYIPVGKTALSAALTTANPITQGAYTTVAWTDFTAARAAATTVLNDAVATQAEIDAATATLNAAYDALKVTDSGQRFLNDVSEYQIGTTGSLIHVTNHDWSLHTGVVKVDGNPLTLNTDYTSASGSTQTTLKASYLDTLSVGTHTLTVEFSSGIAPVSATFEILAAAGGSGSGIPATGDNSLLPALLAGFLALVGASLLGIASRRKNHVGARRK